MFFKVTLFRAWFPALPFIGYWMITFLLYEFGPIINPQLNAFTYFYFFLSMTLFVLGYKKSLNFQRCFPIELSNDWLKVINGYSRRWLRFLAPVAFMGALGFPLDRIMSGAGSFSKTLYETQYVREDQIPTTFLTTLSVIPYSFAFIVIALYFYCHMMRWKVSRFSSFCFWGILGMLCLNAFLSTNRGNFFWVVMYLLFWLYFVQGESLTSWTVIRKHRTLKYVILGLFVFVFIYSFFIAKNRSSSLYLQYEAQIYFHDDRYGLFNSQIDSKTLAAGLQLFTYGTHQYEFIDAFLMKADPFAFRPSMLLGGRLLSQVERVVPGYVPGAVAVGREWVRSAGLPPFAWPSVFGWALVIFGYVGAPLFFLLLGWLYGSSVGHFLRHLDAASLILILCMYAALNMSFNWIGGDFTNNMGYIVGLSLLCSARRKLRSVSFHQRLAA